MKIIQIPDKTGKYIGLQFDKEYTLEQFIYYIKNEKLSSILHLNETNHYKIMKGKLDEDVNQKLLNMIVKYGYISKTELGDEYFLRIENKNKNLTNKDISDIIDFYSVKRNKFIDYLNEVYKKLFIKSGSKINNKFPFNPKYSCIIEVDEISYVNGIEYLYYVWENDDMNYSDIGKIETSLLYDKS